MESGIGALNPESLRAGFTRPEFKVEVEVWAARRLDLNGPAGARPGQSAVSGLPAERADRCPGLHGSHHCAARSSASCDATTKKAGGCCPPLQGARAASRGSQRGRGLFRPAPDTEPAKRIHAVTVERMCLLGLRRDSPNRRIPDAVAEPDPVISGSVAGGPTCVIRFALLQTTASDLVSGGKVSASADPFAQHGRRQACAQRARVKCPRMVQAVLASRARLPLSRRHPPSTSKVRWHTGLRPS